MNKPTSCLHLMTTLLLASGLCMAQNPFRSLGVKESEAPVLTLSNGRYPEVIENDTLIRIGSVLLHGPSGTIAGFIQTDTLYSESGMEPEIISKWLSPDPVIKPFESPYAGMGNNPILYMDPDGRDSREGGRKLYYNPSSMIITKTSSDGTGRKLYDNELFDKYKWWYRIDVMSGLGSGNKPIHDFVDILSGLIGMVLEESPLERVINASMSENYQMIEINEQSITGNVTKFTTREIGDLGVEGFSAEVKMKTVYEVYGIDGENKSHLVRRKEETIYNLERNPSYAGNNKTEAEYRYKIQNFKYYYSDEGSLLKMDSNISYVNAEPEKNTGKVWSSSK